MRVGDTDRVCCEMLLFPGAVLGVSISVNKGCTVSRVPVNDIEKVRS